MSRLALLIATFSLLVSCTQSLDIQLEPQVEVYFSDDSERIIPLTEENNEYGVLNEWLSENNSNWRPTSGRYPGGIYVKSGEYGIQITKTDVILYSTTSYTPKAIYIQRIDKGSLSEIRNIGE